MKEVDEKTAIQNEFAELIKTADNLDKQHILGGLTPSGLASLLNEANEGNADKLLRLLGEIEWRDAHYRATLQTRKTGLASIKPEVMGDTAQAEAVRALLAEINYEGLILNLTDGLAKGYSVVEIIWQTETNIWQPIDFIFHDPRCFKYRAVNRDFVIAGEYGREIEIPKGKAIIHEPRMISGLPCFAGVGLPVLWAFLLKNYALADWAVLLEIFGHPIRLGKYHGAAGQDDKDVLWRAVKNIGRDFAAIVPEGMEIEFINALQSGNGPGYENALRYLDEQISKAVLGQTMTADNGSSLSQAEVHNDIRLELKQFDAKALARTLNRYLVRPFIDFNFGRQKQYPQINLNVEVAEDISAWISNATKAADYGVGVNAKQVRQKLGLPEDSKGDDILTPPGQNSYENKKDAQQASGFRGDAPQIAAAKPASALDQLLQAADDDWELDVAPLVKSVQKLARQAKNDEDFIASLPKIIAQHDQGDMIARLAHSTSLARALGDASDKDI